MKHPSVFTCVMRSAVQKHSFRRQGQSRLSESIGYLQAYLEATAMNVLVCNKAIAVWIASGYCTSSCRDKELFNTCNFLPVHLLTRQWTDKVLYVCVCLFGHISVSIPVRSVNMCLCASSWELCVKMTKHFLPSGMIQTQECYLFACFPRRILRWIKCGGRSDLTSPQPLLSPHQPEIVKKNSCWQVLWEKSNTVRKWE